MNSRVQEIRERWEREKSERRELVFDDASIRALVFHARSDIPYLLDRVEELEAALEPFVRAAGEFPTHYSGSVVADHRTGSLTVGDFRRARALLTDSEDS